MYLPPIRREVLIPLLVSLLLASQTAECHAIRFFPLGDLPGGPFQSRATAVTDTGLVVGVSNYEGFSGSTYQSEMFRWTEETGMQGLGVLRPRRVDPEDYRLQLPAAISADGKVIAGTLSHGETSPALDATAFRWSEADGFQALGDLPGGRTGSQAYDMSADGSVIVGKSNSSHPNNSGSQQEAFRWTEEDGMVGLGRFGDSPNESRATAVSADGSIIYGINSWFSDTSSGWAFRWTELAGMVGLEMQSDNSVYDVSADGSIVVGSDRFETRINGRRDHSIYWTEESGSVSLGVNLWATGISADGQVIVGTGSTDVDEHGAYVWTQNEGLHFLRDLVLDGGADTGGWDLTTTTLTAFGVSPNGRYIVGSGYHSNLTNEAFLVDLGVPVPEPSSFVFCLSAISVIGAARSRRT